MVEEYLTMRVEYIIEAQGINFRIVMQYIFAQTGVAKRENCTYAV